VLRAAGGARNIVIAVELGVGYPSRSMMGKVRQAAGLRRPGFDCWVVERDTDVVAVRFLTTYIAQPACPFTWR
jgi:hypothetical protein